MDQSEANSLDFKVLAEREETDQASYEPSAPDISDRRSSSSGSDSPPLVLDSGARVRNGRRKASKARPKPDEANDGPADEADLSEPIQLTPQDGPGTDSDPADAKAAEDETPGSAPKRGAADRPWALKPMFTRPRQTVGSRTKEPSLRAGNGAADAAEPSPARRRLPPLTSWGRKNGGNGADDTPPGLAEDDAASLHDGPAVARRRVSEPPLTLISPVRNDDPPLRAPASAASPSEELPETDQVADEIPAAEDAATGETGEDMPVAEDAAAPDATEDVAEPKAMTSADPDGSPEAGHMDEAADSPEADEAPTDPATSETAKPESAKTEEAESAMQAEGPAAEDVQPEVAEEAPMPTEAASRDSDESVGTEIMASAEDTSVEESQADVADDAPALAETVAAEDLTSDATEQAEAAESCAEEEAQPKDAEAGPAPAEVPMAEVPVADDPVADLPESDLADKAHVAATGSESEEAADAYGAVAAAPDGAPDASVDAAEPPEPVHAETPAEKASSAEAVPEAADAEPVAEIGALDDMQEASESEPDAETSAAAASPEDSEAAATPEDDDDGGSVVFAVPLEPARARADRPADPEPRDAAPEAEEASAEALDIDDDGAMEARVLAEVAKELERRAQEAAEAMDSAAESAPETPPEPDAAPPSPDDEAAVAMPQDKSELRSMIRDILQQEIETTMAAEIDRRVQSVVAERLLQAFAPRPGS